MAITWTDVTNIAPELSTIAAATQTAILATVAAQVPSSQWGDAQNDGQAWLAAHIATLTKRRGDGPLASRGVGPLSQSYQSMLSFGMLGATGYGLEYRRQLMLLPTVRGGLVP